MDKAKKSAIIKDFARSDSDVGSEEVQVAVLTARISEISGHLGTHPKDNGSRRGLLDMVNRRRRLLAYLKRTNLAKYQEVVKRLELRH